jgi:hypothetical protein
MRAEIQRIAREHFPTGIVFPSERNLYVRIVWLRTKKVGPDTDNIAKWVIDALKGIAYGDDEQVAKCAVEKVEISESIQISVKTRSGQTDRAYGELLELLGQQKEHIIYIEVGVRGDETVVLGPIDEV